MDPLPRAVRAKTVKSIKMQSGILWVQGACIRPIHEAVCPTGTVTFGGVSSGSRDFF